MTEDETLIAERELRKRGYTFIYRFRGEGREWKLRARKHPPLSPQGLREQPVEVNDLADLRRLLAAPE